MAQFLVFAAAMKAMFDFFAHKIEAGDLRAGDHIYAFRSLMIYSHQGIYVGMRDGAHRVVHFVGGIKSDTPHVRCPLAEDCRTNRLHRRAGVTINCLSCFLNGSALHRYKYGASREEYLFKRGGTCTPDIADEPATVVARALDMLERNAFGVYDLVERNCETFALYCTTGNMNSQSSQVRKRHVEIPAPPNPT